MKRTYFKYLFLLIPFAWFTSSAQDITGIWKGYFVSDYGEYYKLEFQIANNSANFSSGVSYSYLDIRFYGKATMTGSYMKSTKNLKIKEIKTVEVKNLDGNGTCIMNYNLFYSKSGKEEFLEGTFLGKQEVINGPNPYKWGDCGGGKVFLRKVRTTDFYIEPFLRNKIKNVPVIVNQPPLKKDSIKTKPVVKTNTAPVKKPVTKPITKTNTTPVNKPVVINKNKPIVTKPITKTNTTPVKKPAVDTTQKNINPVTKIPQPALKTPDVLKSRTNELVKVLTVHDPDVTVKIYDNGEIDGDSISVYLDKKLVLSKKGLTANPLTVNFKIDQDNSEHELVMVAENLGRIPPNTSLMIVEAGEQRFDVRITSTEQKNAMVRFKYEKPK
ncbi:MAG TPA: hypothetical protein VK483_10895 [Chitinophagaceae bacterium]|nr:hypothetical protein [Chitinophagaceae bacterium]